MLKKRMYFFTLDIPVCCIYCKVTTDTTDELHSYMLRTLSRQLQAIKIYIIKTKILKLTERVSCPGDDHLVIETCSHVYHMIKRKKVLC
jgi:hypothetical protein